MKAELARLRETSASLVSSDVFEKEVSARRAAEDELARQKAILESEMSAARRKTGNAKEDKRFALLEASLEEIRKQKEQLEEEVARITEEKETLENQYDDALNNTLISFKSPARPAAQGSARKSVGRLSLSGYADEFASLGVSNAELEALNKRTAELEHIVERQAEEIERLIKKGSVDDSYDMEGLDQRYAHVQELLDAERVQATKYREEASRLSGLVESLNSERGVLLTRVRKYQEDELAYEATIAELESLQAECLAMRSEIETYKKRVFNGDQTIEQLSRHVETSKNHIFSLEDRLKVAERDLEASKYDNNALEQVLTRKNTVLNTELNNARSEIRKLRDESGESKTLNHKLKQENIDLSTNLQRWQAKANELETKQHDSETEAKRARSELESIKRETAVALRNSEIREKEMSATLMDNQTEMGNLSTELRNVKNERDHLVNQIRNVNDQIHEMKHSSAELMSETIKKHEAELVAFRQKGTELEALLQSARREKAHYESQLKAVQKQGGLETQAAQARVKELEQALEAQKKLNLRLQRDNSTTVNNTIDQEKIQVASVVGGAQITVLGSPAVVVNNKSKELQAHVSQPVALAPSQAPLQRHPTAPIFSSSAVQQRSDEKPIAVVPVSEAVASSPLAFWRAKINSQQQAQAQNAASVGSSTTSSRTPVLIRKPDHPHSPLVKVPHESAVSMVNQVRKELEETELSPIVAARSGSDAAMVHEDEDDLLLDNKENTENHQHHSVPDAFSKAWEAALSSRPPQWREQLSRLDDGTYKLGSKSLVCRMIGSDMLVIDGKSQMLVDRFLDQHGGSHAVQAETEAPSESAAVVKKPAGLRFKNLKKQPLIQPNDNDVS